MKQLALFLCFSAALLAQSQARLVGTVADATGAVVSKVNITVMDAKTGADRKAESDDHGAYVITNLPPSTYSVTAEAPGFATARYTDFVLAVGQERNLNITLQPASVSESITVSGGELSLTETATASMGSNVNQREVAALPLNGRQLSQLYLLAPGAQTAGGGSYDNIRFSGRANQQNAIRFDGVEGSSIVDASPGNLNGETSTGFRLQSSLETVAEFRVESSNYPAELGTGSAGQISVVTKSGGNDFHGSVFEYVRNDSFDARNFFDGSSKTPLRLNQYGASGGGAIKKNKLFYFLSNESLRQRAGINLIATVPSAAARARAVDSIKPLLAGYPTGGAPTSNPDLELVSRRASTTMDEYFGSARIDYNLDDKTMLYVRYNRDQGYIQSPLDVSGSYSSVIAVPQNAVINLQRAITPTMMNEFKMGMNGSKTRIAGYAPAIPGIDTSAFAVSFTGTVAIPGIGGQGASAAASSLGNIVRSNSSQNGRGQPYTNYTLSFIDNLSWIKSNHTFKFGFEYRPIRMYTDRLGGTTYTFSNLNALLANTPSQIQVLGDTSSPSPWHNGVTGNRALKQHYLIGYAQDEWKIRPNFTMSYGLRYEFYSVLREDRGLGVLFNATTGQIMPQGTPWYKSAKNNFGPRLAFTWSPEKFKNKTVFRIGAGYYYGPGQTEDQVQPIDSDRASRTLTNTAFPIIPAQVLAGYDINSTTLGYQPRGYAADYKIPEKVLSYTASWQQELPSHTIMTVAFVGSQGRNLFLRSWTNGITGVTMNPTTGVGSPVLQFGNRFAQIDYKTSGGTDNYSSMQMTLNRRFAKGLTAGFQWTYGHSIGNTGGSNEAQTAQNPFNFKQDHGNNAFDVRHSANLSLLYQLPFKFNGFKERVLGGWEVGSVVNARTGLPVDITMSRPDLAYQVNATGQYVNAPIVTNGTVMTTPVINNPFGGAFRNNRRPDVVAGVDPFLQGTDGRYFLNPAAFAIPQPGKFGNLGRYAIHGPGLNQVDFTVHKKFRVTERVNLEFRAELYNAFNRANFANPPAVLSNALGTGTNQLQPGQSFSSAAAGSAFGVINSTVSKDVGLGAQRQAQFSLRLNF